MNKEKCFDDYYHGISEGLGEDPSAIEQFCSLETDLERVKFLLPRAKDRAWEAVCGGVIEPSAEWYLKESSKALNEEGNVRKALRLCNAGLRGGLAAPDEALLAFRASLLSRLHYFEDALTDCDQLAANSKDAQTNIKVLLVRSSCHRGLGACEPAERCLSEALALLRASTTLNNEAKASLAMQIVSQRKANQNTHNQTQSNDEHQSFPRLMSSEHPSIPSTCDAIELRSSPQKGRHFVAATNIPPGSVLICEAPYAWMLSPSAWSDHCAYCCKPVVATVPCSFCFALSYCDACCRDAAWLGFHRWECGVLEHFASSRELSTMAQLVLRVVVSAGLENLRNPFKDLNYQAVFCQITNSAKRPLGDMVKRTLTAIFLEQCLEKTGFCSGEEDALVVASALLRHLQSCSCNAYEITEHASGEAVALGGAVYSSISLLNHACNNNVARHSHGTRCVVRAVRAIHKGEEILDNYGYTFLSSHRDERRAGLLKQYFFNCNCEACAHNWPLYSELSESIALYRCGQCERTLSRPSCQHCNSSKEAKNIDKKLKNCLANYNKAVSNLTHKDSVSILLNCLKELSDRQVIQPNKDFLRCQQALIRCWSLMGNVNNQ